MKPIDADDAIERLGAYLMADAQIEWGGTASEDIEDWKELASDILKGATTIKTKQVKYYDDDEKVWKIGEVIANTLHDLTDSYKGSEYNGNIKD